LFGAGAGAVLSWLVRSTGQVAISNYDLAAFFTQPPGMLFLLLSAASGLALFQAEQAGLMAILRGGWTGRRAGAIDAVRLKARQLPGVLQLALLQAAILMLLLTPVLAVLWVIQSAFLGQQDINYYLKERPPEFWWAAGLAGTLLALTAGGLAWLLTRWLLALPLVLFETKKPVAALRASWRRSRNQVWSMLRTLAAWWIALAALSGITAAALRTVASFFLAGAGSRLAWVLLVVLLVLTLIAVTTLLWLAVGKSGHAAVVLRRYLEHAPPTREAETGPAPKWLIALSTEKLGVGAWTVIVLVALAAGVSIAAVLSQAPVHRIPDVTAHRGSSLKAPENTLSAIRQAIADGADFAEIDVQTTDDGQVVLLHDADFMRVAGDRRALASMTLAEVKEIDVGSRFGAEFANERVPTLGEAIETAQGRIRLNIELKYNRPDPRLARTVGQIIAEKDFGNRCVVTSLDATGLREMKRLSPNLKTGLIVFRAVGNLVQADTDFFSLSAGAVAGQFVRRAHRAGKSVHVWTVNDVQNTLTMVETGVDNIITDNPVLIREVLREWTALPYAEKFAIGLRRLLFANEKLDLPES
jgi:glycerophosphoryl diester phosphodiesterase